MNNFNDFHTVKDLKFDILKLRTALKQVLSRKSYDDAAGTKHIAGFRRTLSQSWMMCRLCLFAALSGVAQHSSKNNCQLTLFSVQVGRLIISSNSRL